MEPFRKTAHELIDHIIHIAVVICHKEFEFGYHEQNRIGKSNWSFRQKIIIEGEFYPTEFFKSLEKSFDGMRVNDYIIEVVDDNIHYTKKILKFKDTVLKKTYKTVIVDFRSAGFKTPPFFVKDITIELQILADNLELVDEDSVIYVRQRLLASI